MGRTQFENLRVYQLAEELADLCWKIVGMWNAFAQMTVGRQLVTAADSVGANIAEGPGEKALRIISVLPQLPGAHFMS